MARGTEGAATHTPGPWSVTWVHGNHFTVQQHLNFPDGSGVPLGSPSEANARLIAAAPELYEALHNTKTLLEAFATRRDDIARAVFEQADAALAKAEGRQP